MAKKKSPPSGSSNTLLSLAIFVNLLAVGLSLYLTSTFQRQLNKLGESNLELSSRIAELENNKGSIQEKTLPRVKINSSISQKEINASVSKLIDKSSFKLDGHIFCSEGPNEDGDYNVVIFKNGTVYDYLVRSNTRITKKTDLFGKGKYILNGFTLTATINFSNDQGVKIFHLQISGLSAKQTNVSEISLSSGNVWSTKSCFNHNITQKR